MFPGKGLISHKLGTCPISVHNNQQPYSFSKLFKLPSSDPELGHKRNVSTAGLQKSYSPKLFGANMRLIRQPTGQLSYPAVPPQQAAPPPPHSQPSRHSLSEPHSQPRPTASRAPQPAAPHSQPRPTASRAPQPAAPHSQPRPTASRAPQQAAPHSRPRPTASRAATASQSLTASRAPQQAAPHSQPRRHSL